MLLLNPVTIETIAMTVATPTTIPSTVRAARSLWARTARSANRTFSPNPRRRWVKSLLMPSFVSQGLDRRQLARLGGGEPAGQQARDRRDSDPDQDEREPHLRREDLVDRHGDRGSQDH